MKKKCSLSLLEYGVSVYIWSNAQPVENSYTNVSTEQKRNKLNARDAVCCTLGYLFPPSFLKGA